MSGVSEHAADRGDVVARAGQMGPRDGDQAAVLPDAEVMAGNEGMRQEQYPLTLFQEILDLEAVGGSETNSFAGAGDRPLQIHAAHVHGLDRAIELAKDGGRVGWNVGPDARIFQRREDRSEPGRIAVGAHQAWVEPVEQQNVGAGGLPPFAVRPPFRFQVADGESGPRPVLVENRFENRGVS